MKDTRSILIRYFAICITLQVAAMVYMTTPALAEHRNVVASNLGLTIHGIWLPVSFILIVAMGATLLRLVKVIAMPFRELAQRAEHGQISDFAFRKKSKTKEEDHLKHYLESQSLKANEYEQQIEELEEEISRLNEEFDGAFAQTEEQERTIIELRQQLKQVTSDKESLKASNDALDYALENERNAKVGREVEKRTDEIYAQLEQAVTASASKLMWQPSAIKELKMPMSIIRNISGRLKDSWTDASFARLLEEIEEIHAQSERQLAMLGGLASEQEPVKMLPQPEPELEEELAQHIELEQEKPVELGLGSKIEEMVIPQDAVVREQPSLPSVSEHEDGALALQLMRSKGRSEP